MFLNGQHNTVRAWNCLFWFCLIGSYFSIKFWTESPSRFKSLMHFMAGVLVIIELHCYFNRLIPHYTIHHIWGIVKSTCGLCLSSYSQALKCIRSWVQLSNDRYKMVLSVSAFHIQLWLSYCHKFIHTKSPSEPKITSTHLLSKPTYFMEKNCY